MTPKHDLPGSVDPATGLLGRPISTTPIDVPNVVASSEGWLRYGYFENRSIKSVDPGTPHAAAILDEFIALAPPGKSRTNAKAVVRFVQNWGPLSLCVHRLPASHNRPPHSSVLSAGPVWWCKPTGFSDLNFQAACRAQHSAPERSTWGRERIVDWFSYANRARAILRVNDALLSANQPDAVDVTAAIGPTDGALAKSWAAMVQPEQLSAASIKAAIAEVVSDWLSWGGVALELGHTSDNAFGLGLATGWRQMRGEHGPWLSFSRVGWTSKDGAVEKWTHTIGDVQGGGVFGVIAMQLALALIGGRAVAVCSNCGAVFTPLRRPRNDERAWCDRDECKRAARAAASRASRRRPIDQKGGPGRKPTRTWR